MSSYAEIRRVRSAMSAAADHDVRRLIQSINERRPKCVERIVDPGDASSHACQREAGRNIEPSV